VTAMDSEFVLGEGAVRVSAMFCMFSFFRDQDRRQKCEIHFRTSRIVACAHHKTRYKTRCEVVKTVLRVLKIMLDMHRRLLWERRGFNSMVLRLLLIASRSQHVQGYDFCAPVPRILTLRWNEPFAPQEPPHSGS
jgi:hypothetical protein